MDAIKEALAMADNDLRLLRDVTTPTKEKAMSAIDDIAAERGRQMRVEGWSSSHDDEHDDGSLGTAAACYALGLPKIAGRVIWPWDFKWWKPKDRRRDLVRAGALIVAEIERLDRAGGVK